MIPRKKIREITQRYGSELDEREETYIKFSELEGMTYLALDSDGGCFGCYDALPLERVFEKYWKNKKPLFLKKDIAQILDNPIRVITPFEDKPIPLNLIGKDLCILENGRMGEEKDILTSLKAMNNRDSLFNIRKYLETHPGDNCFERGARRLLMIRDILNPKSITYCPGDFSFELKVPCGDRK